MLFNNLALLALAAVSLAAPAEDSRRPSRVAGSDTSPELAKRQGGGYKCNGDQPCGPHECISHDAQCCGPDSNRQCELSCGLANASPVV
jgi:hypothetical protein